MLTTSWNPSSSRSSKARGEVQFKPRGEGEEGTRGRRLLGVGELIDCELMFIVGGGSRSIALGEDEPNWHGTIRSSPPPQNPLSPPSPSRPPLFSRWVRWVSPLVSRPVRWVSSRPTPLSRESPSPPPVPASLLSLSRDRLPFSSDDENCGRQNIYHTRIFSGEYFQNIYHTRVFSGVQIKYLRYSTQLL